MKMMVYTVRSMKVLLKVIKYEIGFFLPLIFIIIALTQKYFPCKIFIYRGKYWQVFNLGDSLKNILEGFNLLVL